MGVYQGDKPLSQYGKYAYQQAMEGGYKGTQEEFNALLASVGNKQDKITGTSGQVVGFDTDGNLVAQEAPSSVTDEEKAAWNAKADASKSVSVTLAAASWDSTAKTQTVPVTGVKASETAQMITPTPALASQTAYYDAGILCTGQAADSLTFTADTIPTADLTVYVVIQEVSQG